LRQNDEPARKAIRKPRWLPALEQELKSRVGWVDEAVSPFAAKARTAPAAKKIQHNFQTPKAAYASRVRSAKTRPRVRFAKRAFALGPHPEEPASGGRLEGWATT